MSGTMVAAAQDSGAGAVLRRWMADATLDLPLPGGGRTAERWQRLVDIGRHHDVSLARLAEAHVDAVAILAEAGRDPVAGALYGVWASDAGGRVLRFVGGQASGRKAFCSGLGIIDRALVTAVDDHGVQVLLDLDVRPGPHVVHDASGWSTVALAATRTGAVTFDALPAPDAVVHADHRWYLDRPGFWHGACGPAACWAGGALGLVDVAEELIGDDPHAVAHLGALRAADWGMRALCDRAGREIDADPDHVVAARSRARALRHLVEQQCLDVIDRLGRALGPRPMVQRSDVAQRMADVQLYLRQHHAERDLHAAGAEDGFRA